MIAGAMSGLAGEAPLAYKEATRVIEVVTAHSRKGRTHSAICRITTQISQKTISIELKATELLRFLINEFTRIPVCPNGLECASKQLYFFRW